MERLRETLSIFIELLECIECDQTKLREKFMRNYEGVNTQLLLDLGDEKDGLKILQRVDTANNQLESICFSDLGRDRPDLLQIFTTLRKLKAREMATPPGRTSMFVDIKLKKSVIVSNDEKQPLLGGEQSSFKDQFKSFWKNNLLTYFPCIRWARNYKVKRDLRGDFFAGCTVAAMTVPQAMGYALLAGLPPIYGLYASFIPTMVYSFFGTSAELSVGPVSMVSLMLSSTISKIAEPESATYIMYVTFVTFYVGLIIFVAGIFNMGFLIENIMSVPLTTSWVHGAALLIILTQMQGLLQIPIPKTAKSIVSISEAISKYAHQTNLYSLALGGCCLFILIATKLLKRRFKWISNLPMPLIVLALATAASWIFRLDVETHINILGNIPSHLPAPTTFPVTWSLVSETTSLAFTVVIIGFMEGISMAKKFASVRRYRVDLSQELRALGIANLMGSLFQACPVTGSVTRSTINFQSGSRTPFSSLINSILVGCVLLFLAPLLYHTPKASLAAIVISAGFSLMDFDEYLFLWKIREYNDIVQMIAIFLITLFTGPEIGAVFALSLSIFQIVYRSVRPNCISMGVDSNTKTFRDLSFLSSDVRQEVKGVLVVRLDSDLRFFTTHWFRERINTWEKEKSEGIRAVVIDATGVNNIDSTSIHLLFEMLDEYGKQDVQILICNVRPQTMKLLQLSKFADALGEEHFFTSTNQAVEFAQSLPSKNSKISIRASLN